MKVYQMSLGGFGYLGDQRWVAITEEGETIASHISSSRGWGIRDTGPEGFYRDAWPDGAEAIVIEEGGDLPEVVQHRILEREHNRNEEEL